MKRRAIILVMALTMTCLSTSAQIMLTPMIDSSIGGVTANNRALIEDRLRQIIASEGMTPAYGGRFILACRVAALQREVSGNKLIQRLQVTFAIGDNNSNVCYGTTRTETLGIGNTEGQAMTSAMRNIKVTPELRKIIAESKTKILSYYQKNGKSILTKARSLLGQQKWQAALCELAAIPQECSYYSSAASMMREVYNAHLNHDASSLLLQAQALWSSDPNPGPTADMAMSILGQVDPNAKCYSQARALMNKIEARNKAVVDKEHRDAVELEKIRMNNEAIIEQAQIQACRDIAVAEAQQEKVYITNNYSYGYSTGWLTWLLW